MSEKSRRWFISVCGGGDQWSAILLVGLLFSLGCASQLERRPPTSDIRATSLVFGRVTVGLTGSRSRKFEPELRWFEVVHRDTQDRFKIDIRAEDETFLVPLPAGTYELTRVQINEGPFLSMADYALTFAVSPRGVTAVGTWLFGVDSPRYGRRMTVLTRVDVKEQQDLLNDLVSEYPVLTTLPVTVVRLTPTTIDSRLYEVMPYPRYTKYFRRHWW